MKLSKDMLWAAPYLQAARSLYRSHRVVDVLGLRSGNINMDGWCSRTPTGWYRVRVRLRTGRIPTTLEERLCYLAHELAHTLYWEHDANHYNRMVDILKVFSHVMYAQDVRNTQTRKYL